MGSRIPDEDFFEKLSAANEVGGFRAPSRLKSKIYSALLRRQAESGPLLSLSLTKAEGRDLCVFENLARISPVGERLRSFNFCSVCHARVLAEQIEGAPIAWRHCPYVLFQNR